MSFKVRTKLLFGFIAVALIGTAIGVIGITNIKVIDAADTFMYEKATVPIGYLGIIEGDFKNIRINLFRLFLVGSDVERKALVDEIDKLSANMDAFIEKYKTTYLSADDQLQWETFIKLKVDYLREISPILQLAPAGRLDEARVILDNGAPTKAAELVQTQLDKIVVLNLDAAKATSDNNTVTANTSTVIMIVSMVVGLMVSVFLALWLGVWVVSRPLMRITNTLQAGSEQIAAASNQLASSAQMLSSGATEQASSIEETSASMEELASMVKQNLASSREASLLSEKASGASKEGYADMVKMVDSMKDIAKSSQQVGKVIKLIEDISFQTNILALNAAVEAARAGEAGVGFAVVADEVKNLANRSADAAKDTTQMIEDAIRKIEEGGTIANRLAEAFKGILDNVQKVAIMSKEVEVSSTQQDTGINQVTQAIVQFDQVVQSNASTSEESASSAEELSSQAGSLMNVVQDLTKMVNGKVAQNQPLSVAPHHASHALSHVPAHVVPHVPASVNPSISGNRKTPALVAVGGDHGNGAHHRVQGPEEIISFENDEELQNN